MKNRIIISLIILTLAITALTGCKSENEETEVLKVGATPVPHAEILERIKPILEAEGIKLEIVEFTDYVTPNIALSDGEIDANFFQHVPYMDSFAKEHDLELESLGTVHVEPLGLYSNIFTSVDGIENGFTIAIPNDPTNEGRALLLLQSKGIITLASDAGLEATEDDIVENPLGLVFKPIDAAQLPRTLEDVSGAIINTNYALEAGLNPVRDAVLIEGSDSPYANIVTVTPNNKADEKVLKLIEVLQSEEVRSFINEKYEGAVVPAF